MANQLLVISSYPEKGSVHGAGTVGIASYTKNTLLNILKAAQSAGSDLKITVLAEKLEKSSESEYFENGLEVKRIWKRSSLLSYLSILAVSLKSDAGKILVELEVSMFGGPIYLLLFPLFLRVLSMLGKQVYFIPHQIIADINELSGHIGVSRNSFSTKFLNVFIRMFFNLSVKSSYKTIVFEDYFRRMFDKKLQEKITVIPHGVEAIEPAISYQSAREKLGIKKETVLLYFGFIAWYKGVDWIAEKIVNSDVKLIIAGGTNPNHQDKPYYMEYVKKIENLARLSKDKIVVTGFVDEEKIPLYYQAADLVVFPYRTFMSSSGPLAMAFSYGKPVILSEAISGYMNTADFQKAMEKARLTSEDMFFPLSDYSWEKKLKNPDLKIMDKLKVFSKLMREKRDFGKIGRRYYEYIFKNEQI